jgi:folate-binding protein YgfZ
MNEAGETLVSNQSPLDVSHQRLGAVVTERDGWSVPASYGDVLLEYAAVREGGVGLIDLSSRGRLLVSGSEAVQFLNGLITNDMKTLAENQWMPAVFPTVQGRLIASVRVIHTREGFLIDTEPATKERVLQTVARFTLAGDFRVADLTTEMAQLSLQGLRAAKITAAVFGETAIGLSHLAVAVVPWNNSQVTIIRATHTAEDGFDLFVEASAAATLWEALTAAGARPIGFDAFEILRIEAGQPRYGIDMDETNVVTETNLDEAISYTKGCYIGQEIVARIKYRGHVAKKLKGLLFARGVKVQTGATIRSLDEKDIGRITSATLSPHLGRTVALGYVKYDYLATGTSVKVVSGDQEFTAEVTELPFVRGSWFASQAGATVIA